MPALATDEVLRREAHEILSHRKSSVGTRIRIEQEQGTALYRKLNQCKFAALCLSGGGIRSAAFSLGIIQALARFPRALSPRESNTISDSEIQERAKSSLLSKFDYLSTVSGGGYIGSWLSAWCSREGFQSVWKHLVSRPDGPDVEPQPIGWLRSYSNYLTPRLGMLSSDTWSAFSIYICNLFLNWLIILPLFCCAILGLKILAVLLDALMILKNPLSLEKFKILGFPLFEREVECSIHWQPYAIICGLLGVLLLIIALSFAARNLILRGRGPAAEAGPTQKAFLWSALVPSVVSAILIAQLLGSDPFGKLFEQLSKPGCDPIGTTVLGAVIDDVTPNGVANRAGIQKGDVIIEFDGNTINTAGDLAYFLKKKAFGDVVPVVARGEKSTEIKLNPLPGTSALRTPSIIDLGIEIGNPPSLEPRFSQWKLVLAGSVVGSMIYLIALLVGWGATRKNLLGGGLSSIQVAFAWTASGAVYGAILALAFYLYLTSPGAGPVNAMFIDSPALPLTIGVPLVLCSQLVAQFVFVGLSSYRPESDLDREWQARAGGWLLIAAIGWFAMSFLTFGGLWLLLQSDYFHNVWQIVRVAAVPSGLSGIATALLSKSALTADTHVGAQGIWAKVANIALAIAAPLFIAGLVFLLSIALDKLFLGHLLFQDNSLTAIGRTPTPEEIEKVYQTLIRLSLGFVGFFALLCLASYCININRFSLHAFYRNRLIRAFLGASRARKPDPFYGFDPKDDPRMHTLWPPPERSVWQPFHVINMTLNLVLGKKLSWQERKGASFTASPLHCGTGSGLEFSHRLGQPVAKPCGTYRPADEYGAGISLGTAMAISGAAVSSNMGYHSSPAVTFLMSMLNVRLGWWLGNPAVDRGRPYIKDSPTLALLPLLAETFGLTTDDRKYIYLSDGGHFENLGLYEMVRRRCRFILVVDAGCDRTFSFEDLGNAVRKIAIDLDVSIRFHHFERLKARADEIAVQSDYDYHIMGEVDYCASDGAQENGIILYIKPGYRGNESAGVRGYAISHPEFPHESTRDQWFSESQFESYRALGFEIMDKILKTTKDDPNCDKNPSLENVFNALYKKATKQEEGKGVATAASTTGGTPQ